MQIIALLISILVFATIVLLAYGLFYFINYRSKQQALIGKIQKSGAESVVDENTSDSSGRSDNKISFALNIIERAGDLFKPKSDDDIIHMRKSLIRAGYRKRNSFVIFYGVKSCLGILLPVCFSGLKFMVISTMTSANFILLVIVLALFGFYLPNIWLKQMIDTRQRKILEGLPDALDLMIVCVEAGMGLDSAISRAAREIKLSNKEVGEELNLVTLELRAGKLRSDALRNLARRTGLEEINSLVSLLVQTDKFGTSVAQALRVHSDSMRDKRFQRADELAAKLPVKLLFPMILFIFPAIFVVLVGPAAIRIIRNLFPLLSG